MEASGEFVVMNEPAIYPFVLTSQSDRELTEGWFQRTPYATFDEMKQNFLKLAEQANVFVKEICFFVEDFLLQDDAFVSDPNIQFVFLIRNPHDAIVSYYKKYLRIVPNFSHFIGCQTSYKIFQGIKDKVKNPVIVLSAEDLCDRTENTAQWLFSSLSIPFKPKCLHWDDLGDDFTGVESWNEAKIPAMLYHWHDHAIHSTGFQPITKNMVDAEGKPTFEEVPSETDRSECFKMYYENIYYYQKLLEQTKRNTVLADDTQQKTKHPCSN